jgi:hypothetical protein
MAPEMYDVVNYTATVGISSLALIVDDVLIDCKKRFCSTIERRYHRSLMLKKLTGFPMNPPHDILAFLPDSEPIESTFRSVETKSMLDGDLCGTYGRTGITIIPSGNLSWTFLINYYSPQQVG